MNPTGVTPEPSWWDGVLLVGSLFTRAQWTTLVILVFMVWAATQGIKKFWQAIYISRSRAGIKNGWVAGLIMNGSGQIFIPALAFFLGPFFASILAVIVHWSLKPGQDAPAGYDAITLLAWGTISGPVATVMYKALNFLVNKYFPGASNSLSAERRSSTPDAVLPVGVNQERRSSSDLKPQAQGENP